MKKFRIWAALALALVTPPVAAQVNPGTSPLSIAKGGTSGATAAAARAALGLTIGSAVQAWDADLDCIAANSTAGFLAYTGAGTCSYRTMTAPAAGFTITNPAGTAGNPTFVLANDLGALEALSSTGFAVRTASDTWAQRSIAGTANEITLTNGDGVSGNPTASLPAALTFTGKTITGGSFASPALTGTPTAPTAAPSNNSTQIATTAYVDAQVTAGTAGVASLNGATGALKSYFPPQGRLTLVTATPVMTTTQSAKTTIFYTPYHGNMVPIYDGTNMLPTVVAEISVATTDTTKSPAAIGASKVNDWFVWNDSSTIRISHGPDWTSDTARSAGTALTLVNGIYLNNASLTNGPAASRGTYVGTTRSNGSSQLDFIFGASASGGTAAFFGVWNAYNRVSTGTQVTDSGTSYTYTSATIRQARASAGNQISFVLGLAEDAISFSYTQRVDTVAVLNAGGGYGVGFDSTSTFGAQRNNVVTPAAVSFISAASNAGAWSAGLGFHTLSANESSDGSNANTFDAVGLAALSAIVRN